MVLEQGFNTGKQPVKSGKRKVVPGSRPILDKLRRTGLAELYEDAGFEIGIPGCSYCVGMSADVAGEGEVWLSSQNRNFKNRMGKGKSPQSTNDFSKMLKCSGSIGHITSAAAVAASSFDMKVTSPKKYLEDLDIQRLRQLLSRSSTSEGTVESKIVYVEPAEAPGDVPEVTQTEEGSTAGREEDHPMNMEIRGKIQRLGDFVRKLMDRRLEAFSKSQTQSHPLL